MTIFGHFYHFAKNGKNRVRAAFRAARAGAEGPCAIKESAARLQSALRSRPLSGDREIDYTAHFSRPAGREKPVIELVSMADLQPFSPQAKLARP
eukprot:NODE_9237_length_482_cov_3.376443_g8157_i0.p2 GENE.NODE_9237_length_482_cov_3.376443_g8157_i0~~NODE_9237_length_482_cov_3.376443_g8157_i0.p2  ORF type:complete len:95 (+),score=2.11 NODE_9237_length_482_cov_3.376443_g8157_i0:115-399(+)